MLQMVRACFLVLSRYVRTRRDLVLENLALRQQLAVLAARQPRPHLTSHDRVFWSSCGDSGLIGDVFFSLCIPRPWLAGIALDSRCTGNVFRALALKQAGNLRRRRLLNEYVDYYHEDRTHLGLVKETPQDARWKPIQNHNAKLFPCRDWAVCITDTISSHSFLSSYLAQNISKFSPLNLHVLACPILKPPHCSAIKLTQGIPRARPDC